MHVVIDIGNTTHKVAIFSEGELTFLHFTPQLSIPFLRDIIQENPVHGWIISSVGEAPLDVIDFLNTLATGIYFDHTTSIPIQNLYTTPETLGKDRLANVIAASKLFPQKDVLVVDAGTCIKYDVISQEGKYFGGAISPGLTMRFKAMHDYTAKLPYVKTEEIPENVPLSVSGASTKDALIAGGALGAVFEISGFIDSFRKINTDLNIILTGGDAAFFVSRLKNRIFAIPNLTLIGLNTVLEFNIRKF